MSSCAVSAFHGHEARWGESGVPGLNEGSEDSIVPVNNIFSNFIPLPLM